MVLSIQFVLFSVVCLPYSLSSDIKSPKDEIADIRRLLLDQNERILKLESENLALKRDNDLREQVVGVAKKQGLLQNDVVHLRRQLSEIKEQLVQNKTQNSKITDPPNDTLQRTNIKNRRFLALVTDPPPPAPVEAVAFYAYMSKSEPAPSSHFTLIFDVVKTNLGNGYSKYSGTFVAPSAGVYVFTWTINSGVHGAHFINLMVNSAVAGGTLTDTQDATDFDSDSNTAVLVLNQGDNVNLRTTRSSDHTMINADNHAFTSFCGWKL